MYATVRIIVRENYEAQYIHNGARKTKRRPSGLATQIEMRQAALHYP
jgi:isocitrate/isopropylmalate dehydrogenase